MVKYSLDKQLTLPEKWGQTMKNGNYLIIGFIILGIIVLCIALSGILTIMITELSWKLVAIVLTTSVLAAAITSICFSLYLYSNTHTTEKRLNEKLNNTFTTFENKIQQENRIIMEAMQKMIAGYNAQFQLKDINMAISLYQQAVELYPQVYNGYTSLAYAYWYNKKDLAKAKKYFELALQHNPDNYQCLNDLARFSAANEDPFICFQYLKQLLEIKPDEYKTIEKDPIFDSLRHNYPNHYEQVMKMARDKTKNT